MRSDPVPVNTPCAGADTTRYVRRSPSTSLAVNGIALAVSSSVAVDWLTATGGLFTGSTVIVTFAGGEPTCPSCTVNSKESGPW